MNAAVEGTSGPTSSASTSHVWEVLLLNFALSVPRIAILVFIELMAGFFLKQYRTAMEEYRYLKRFSGSEKD